MTNVVWMLLVGIASFFGVPGKQLVNKNYIVLLQNNTELRSTGGFMGSYAQIKLGKSGINSISVHDIYEPDGQMMGHVEPPYPVQEAFSQGWWRLRDANWDVNFASAAASVAWFLEQGGVKPVDGIIAVNQLTINKLIEILGPIKMTTYDEVVTEKNFYQLAQKYAEIDHDKRGFLGAVGATLLNEVKDVHLGNWIKLLKLTISDLKSGQILIWTKDESTQKKIEKNGWSGTLVRGWNGKDDYLYIAESNLGVNKANCCIVRAITQDLQHDEQTIHGLLVIDWKNNNEFETPKPPAFWGGDYRDYVRVVIPAKYKIRNVKVGERELRPATDLDFVIPNSLRQGLSEDMYIVENLSVSGQALQIVGFWAVVPAGETLTVRLNYESGSMNNGRILVRRQPGIESFAYKLIVDGRIVVDENVGQDTFFGIR